MSEAGASRKPEIVIVERRAAVAHPSFAAGGFIVLDPAAKAYRNADMVPASVPDMMAWCEGQRCEIASLDGTDSPSRRYRVSFPDEAALAAFKARFGRPR